MGSPQINQYLHCLDKPSFRTTLESLLQEILHTKLTGQPCLFSKTQVDELSQEDQSIANDHNELLMQLKLRVNQACYQRELDSRVSPVERTGKILDFLDRIANSRRIYAEQEIKQSAKVAADLLLIELSSSHDAQA